MSFNPANFTAPKAKPLPVILLLDKSGSMNGEPIQLLNQAVHEMIEDFSNGAGEVEIQVAIITFGTEVKLHQSLTRATDIEWRDLSVDGMTPMGTAIKMAKAMIEDKDVIPSRAYRPLVVLVSDGGPNDEWQAPLKDFISTGRSAKCDRMAMAIGSGADESVLKQFISGTEHGLFYAENAKKISEFFKFVTMSVTTRTKSEDPNDIPKNNDSGIVNMASSTSDDDDDYLG